MAQKLIYTVTCFVCIGLTAYAEPRAEFFERHIRPVLAEQCFSCHGAEAAARKGDLRVDLGAELLKGGASGAPAVVPGAPEESLLLRALRYQDATLQMPPDGPLPEAVVQLFTQWIADGAYYPEPLEMPATEGADHWAFQTLQTPPVPEVRDTAWVRTPIDAFVLARLEQKGLAPSPPADRATLIRRLSFDLTGLPPSAEAVRAFVEDPDPEAYAHLVDRLLASPAYGERWGRHWLDVARYADTKGYVYTDREDNKFVHSYVYRDWVVNALNQDLPYDEFLRLQLAADQMADAPGDLAALGFLTLGQRFLGVVHDIIDDRIDTVTRGMLGLTVSCARCHDHKFDPVPIEDYYSLYGVFSSASERLRPVAEVPTNTRSEAAFAEELRRREALLAEKFQQRSDELAERLRGQVHRYFAQLPRVRELPSEDFYEIRTTEDLNPSVTRRWNNYIEALPEDDPIFGAWKHLAKAQDFAAAAQSFLADANAASVNSAVLDALRAVPLESLQDLAERYGVLLLGVHEEWKEALKEAQLLGAPAPEALVNPDREALRQVLYAPTAPVRIPKGAIVDVEWYFDEGVRVELSKLQMDIDQWIIASEVAPPFAVTLEDKPEPKNAAVLLRGNPANRGSEVPRQFLEVLAGDSRQPFTEGSGRKELAEAIATRENPLTARVLVNRVWMHHFGAGIVSTPSDFGLRAAAPSHPELLDWLACYFVDDGWSLKKLHRMLVLSATYQQASTGPADEAVLKRAREIDPENALLWRAQPRRLDFEAMRDAMLAVTGELEPRLGGRGFPLFHPASPPRRTLYGYVDRQFLPPVYRVFDFPTPDLHNPQRIDTTVPQQALFLMNSPFLQARARALAAHTNAGTGEARLERLYLAAYQRPPAPTERENALQFVEAAAVKIAPPEDAPDAPAAWQYGYGHYDTDAKQVRFTALPHFVGDVWQGGLVWPSGRPNYVKISARGGHPGSTREHAAIRRWTSPVSGTIKISGTVQHLRAEGDGVVAQVVSSRHGMLGTWPLHLRSAEAAFPQLTVAQGDTLDFIVDRGGTAVRDDFEWMPKIALTTAEATEWSAEQQFAGPAAAAPTPLDAWEKLAQVLLLSNEFGFVQ